MSCRSNIEGTWSYNDLIGSKFKIKSIRLSYYGSINRFGAFKYSGEELTLKAIYFRVSTDGKILTLFRMEEVCGKLFLPKDLELIEISPVSNESTICGRFSPSRKSLIGLVEEEEEEETSSGKVSDKKDLPEIIEDQSSPTINNNQQSEDEKESLMEEDPFMLNINSWEIISL